MNKNHKRIEEIKNTTAMKKILAYNGKAFSRSELKDGLIDVQNCLLYQTFEQTHAENLNHNDLFDYFKNAPSECFNPDSKSHYDRLMEQLICLKKDIGALIAGEKGERQVQNALRVLEFDGSTVLNNIELDSNKYDKSEIDSIVVNKSGIYVLEIKQYKRDIEITHLGNLIERKSKCFYALSAKLNEKEYLIRKILKDYDINIDSKCYRNYLVIANNNISVKDDYKRIPVTYSGTIVDTIRSCEEELISNELIQRIREVLQDAHSPKVYPYSNIDFEQLVDNFAHVLAAIEQASKAEIEQIIEEESIIETVQEEICIDDKLGEAENQTMQEETNPENDSNITNKKSLTHKIKKIFKYVAYGTGAVAAGAAITAVALVGAIIDG